jgi:cytochrome b subunit of formate dehydrogenase
VSEPKVQRFSGFHRVLHWLIAIPYVVLLASGALILLHNLGWVNAPAASHLGGLHRWVGLAFAAIVLELFLAALVSGHWRAVGRDFRAFLVFRPGDLLWLILVPLNSCFPRRFPLPAAGRFNAGQKLHGLFILFAVSGFIVTGLLMILVPGWLSVWLIHAWLFFGATAFLSLHLFLALINPATRRALGGIFTGRVSRAYVRAHHALDLNEGPIEHEPHAHRPHATVSIKAMILALLAVAAALFGWWRGPGQSVVRAAMVSPNKNAIISPGPLASAHSSQRIGGDCLACHSHFRPTTKSACFSCHTEIRTALEQTAGYHGTLTGECAACHKEHHGADADLRNFDLRTFNHNLARFALKGAHRSLACDQCHVQYSPTPGEKRYIGVKSSACTDCHANPHADMPTADCTRCHSEQKWTGHDLLFVHNRDSFFKLDAIHSALSCASCHKQVGTAVVFRGTPASCEQCHKQIADAMAGKIGSLVMKADPHAGRVSCAECHMPGVRSPTPAQFAAQCERCHGVRYRTLFFNWQKSLDEREQSARLRLRQRVAADPQTTQLWNDRLDAAHAAGMHNVQQAIEAFEKVGQ